MEIVPVFIPVPPKSLLCDKCVYILEPACLIDSAFFAMVSLDKTILISMRPPGQIKVKSVSIIIQTRPSCARTRAHTPMRLTVLPFACTPVASSYYFISGSMRALRDRAPDVCLRGPHQADGGRSECLLALYIYARRLRRQIQRRTGETDHARLFISAAIPSPHHLKAPVQ